MTVDFDTIEKDNLFTLRERDSMKQERIAEDKDSSLQLALGSSGVPETFVIDGRGVIRHQHIGDIRPEDVPGILSAVQAAQ